MSLIYTEDQKELIAMVRNMAEKEIKPHVAECDEKGECPIELFKPAIDMGLHVLEIPEQYGGEGLDYPRWFLKSSPRSTPVMPTRS